LGVEEQAKHETCVSKKILLSAFAGFLLGFLLNSEENLIFSSETPINQIYGNNKIYSFLTIVY
jgi:hypothetical protein